MRSFPFSFDKPTRVLFKALLIGHAAVEVYDLEVRVDLGWSFRTVIPRSTIVGATGVERRTISRGAHGWRGEWLVNGSTNGLVKIDLEPRVRAHVAGVPVRVRSLIVSVEDPDGLVAAIEEVLVPVG